MFTEMRRRARARGEERARRGAAGRADAERAAAAAALVRARRRVAIVRLVDAATVSTTPIARRSGPSGDAVADPSTHPDPPTDPPAGAFVLAG